MGMHFMHAAPERYQLSSNVQTLAKSNCRSSGGTLTITDDVVSAVHGADFLYTDLWWWVGQENEIPERRAAFMPAYQLNAQLLRLAPPHCRVMHCLPASRGVEATDEVLDSPQSIIFDLAENRLHTEKALLSYFVYPRLKRASTELKAYHLARVESFFSQHPTS
jgi:putrescine carbamoyltransferase